MSAGKAWAGHASVSALVDQRGLASTLNAADFMMKPVRWETLNHVMERFREGLVYARAR